MSGDIFRREMVPRVFRLADTVTAMKPLVVATDGSSRGNPGRSGWAWVVNKHSWQCGSIPKATSIVAELTAVHRALRSVPSERDVVVLTDSEFCRDVVERYARGWERAGWRRRDGQPPANLELVQALWATVQGRSGATRLEWVRGHNGHPLNEVADRLATQAADAGGGRALVNGPGWAQPAP